jgi:hypothetical protein
MVNFGMAYAHQKLSRRQVLQLLFSTPLIPALAVCVINLVASSQQTQPEVVSHVPEWDAITLRRHAAFVALAKQQTTGKKPPLRTMFVGQYELILPTPLPRPK